MRRASTILTVVGAACLVGCSSVQSPEIRIVDARVVDETPEGVTLEFTLEGSNPNNESLPLREVSYALEVDGRRVFSGRRSAEGARLRLGDQRFLLPAVVPSSDATGSLEGSSYRLAGTAVYLAPGAIAEILFDSGLSRPTVSFAGTGTLGAQ